MNRRLLALPVIVAGLFGLAACTSTTTGSGTPAGSPSAPAAPTTATSSTNGAALAAVQPCSVVSSSVLSQNGLTETNQPATPGARSCTWQKTTDQNGPGFVLGVDVRDSQGLADIDSQGFSLTDDTVGHHQGKQAEDAAGFECFVAIGVTPSSRVDVVVSTSVSAAQSCDLANQYAKLIEPNLP